MSFPTNKPMLEGQAQSALNLQLSPKNASLPAFKPQIVRSVRMHPVVAFGVAALVLVGLVGYALTLKSVYLANSQVYEEPPSASLLSEPSSALFDANKYETFLGEQMQLVQRLDVLTAAMKTLPASTYADFGPTPAQAAENIQTQMKVARVASSYQMSISLKGTDPQKTADIVNAITNSYLDSVRKSDAAESDQRAQLLAEERQRIDSELQSARAEQTALGASIGVANPTGESGNPYDAELSGVRAQLVEARAAHDVAAAQLASLSGVGPSHTDGLTAAADELIAGDAGLGSMKATISQRKAQLNEQMSGMTPTNPIYKQDQDQIADLDRTLDRMTSDLRAKAARRLQDKLRTDLQRTGDIESRLNAQLARGIANATSAAPRLQRASEVAADIQRLDTRMAAVDDALRTLRMRVNGPAQVRLSLPATPPERPEANRRKQLLLAAFPLALLFGAGAAVLARKQNRRIYGGVDIDDLLGFPPLAVLPARADVSARVFEEYVLRLAAGIESAYRTSGARTFLMTAVSLTTDIAPLATALTRKFEEIGVNVVVATASEMLSPTKGVPATSPPQAAMAPGEFARVVELWSKGFVAANVAKMKTEHGLVLIESEALLHCAQTEYVARCADATILIVECGVTTRQELLQAAELLHRLHVTGIGAVLEEVQLRYADVDFRKSIEALDRRQSESPGQDRRPPRQRDVPVAAPVVARVAPVPAAPVAAPEPVAEAVPAAFVAPPAPEAIPAAPVATAEPSLTLLDTEVDRVELEYEPAHYHEVLHHVRATRPTDLDSGWHLPIFDQVPAAPAPIAAAPECVAGSGVPSLVETEVVRPLAAMQAVDREVVENTSRTGLSGLENMFPLPAIAASNGTSHEKIAPKLSVRSDQTTSDGDASMTRNTSWLDKLLRRDSEAVVRIVPDGDDDEVDELVDPPVRVAKPARSAASAQPGPHAVATRPAAQDDYDIPLANRIEQISGARRVAPSATPVARADSSLLRPSSRLQIVPPEPMLPEPEPVVFESPASEELATAAAEAEAPPPAATHFEQTAPAALEPVAAAVAAVPSAVNWATVDREGLEPAATAAAPEAIRPALARSPRRPLTFHELAGIVERREFASVEPALAEQPPPAVEPAVELPSEAAPAEPFPFEVLAHVPEFVPAEPIAAAVAAPEFEAIPEPPAEAIFHNVLPVLPEERPGEDVAEPATLLAEEPVPEQKPVIETIHEAVHERIPETAPEPDYRFSDVQRPPDQPFEPRYPAFEPYRANPLEVDDIEPAYQEASRNLNSGRWDPIPPLRPSTNGWRDRPSPVPRNNNGNGNGADRYHQNGSSQDGFNSNPPRRWVPDAFVDVSPEPEALPEPLLSRQWGLLSRFQQARLVSSHPPAGHENGADRSYDSGQDAGREADEPGYPHGNRQS